MDLLVLLAGVALTAAGFAIGRRWALVLPAAVVPLLYFGADQGWWGNGLGDGWYFAMILVLAVTIAVTAAGVVLRRLARF